MQKIYLDNNATTAIDPTILFHPTVTEILSLPLNSSSRHFFGQKAKTFLEDSRLTIAQFFQKNPSQFIFTSGATESLNLAIRGILFHKKKGVVISSAIEHAAVYNLLQHIKKEGFFDVKHLPVDQLGAPKPEDLEAAITDTTALIVLSGANSETGVEIDLEACAKIALSKNIPLVIDGVALLGKEKFSIPKGVSAMAFSGHKIHAPQGSGFLYYDPLTSISPLMYGGPQENSLRPGTHNLFATVGLALAIKLLNDQEVFITHMKGLQGLFETFLQKHLPKCLINGTGKRICNTSNISFGVDSETLLIKLDQMGICASQGSACQAGLVEPSRVLLNMGLPPDRVKSSLRFSFSRFTTQEEILKAAEVLVECVHSNLD